MTGTQKGSLPDGPKAREQPPLRRVIGLPLLVLYGLGVTIGGGIYVLIGKVVARAGILAPISFILAAVLVSFTAFTFAELAARFPRSAGEAVYVREGLGYRQLAILVGLLVVSNGIISSAALTNGFVGHIQEFWSLPPWLIIVSITIFLGAIAIWGIQESVLAAGAITLIEISGLVLIIWFGRDSLAEIGVRLGDLTPGFGTNVWIGVLSGTFLAFYAFVGFEDMVNVAEEVKDVKVVLPLAIILTLAITTVIYILIVLVAVLSVPIEELSASDAPLVYIFEQTSGQPGIIINVIALFAILNGLLIQIIMASRVLYGMAKSKWLPGWIAFVHPRTQTPLIATCFTVGIILVLSLLFSMEALAETTSLIVFIISILVNAALWKLKCTAPIPSGVFTIPIWVPVTGFFVSVAFTILVFSDLLAPVLAQAP